MPQTPSETPLQLTATQRQLTWLAALAIAIPFILVALNWSAIPDRVPIHFNSAGEVDGWGSKGSILLLPAILGGTTLFILVIARTVSGRNLNIPFQVTEHNAEAHYQLVRTLLIVMAAAIGLVGAYLSWETLQAAIGQRDHISDLTLPLILGATFLPLVWYFWRARQIE
jgi:uncharacterized membrane protein